MVSRRISSHISSLFNPCMEESVTVTKLLEGVREEPGRFVVVCISEQFDRFNDALSYLISERTSEHFRTHE